jgi:methionine synthase / methylenetetrahydrofolate reductase(NADPH)
MEPFQEYLNRHLALFDGAMGTLIYQKGVFIDKCYDELNISNPELIRNIHREYIQAGATVIETNTFGANRHKLSKHNLANRIEDINRAGVRLSKEASQDVYVAGSIGPLGTPLEPYGDISKDYAAENFGEQVGILDQSGADLILFESFHNLDELEAAIKASRSVSKLPIVAHMAVNEDGLSQYGLVVEDIARRLTELGVDALGLNCLIGPKRMLDFLERMVKVTSVPISVMPNAGRPQAVDGRMIYMSTPDYFCVYGKRFIEAGARILGGCCGTTPEHIRKMAEAVAQKETRIRFSVRETAPCSADRPLPPPVPSIQKSMFAKKIIEKRFVKTVEMTAPRGRDPVSQIKGSERLKASGIDAVNIPDGPRASARMNAMAMAVILQTKAGIEAVLHTTCRDKNLLGMQSELVGASALGICNLLAVTGDPPMMGDYPTATAVFDMDSIGLMRMIRNLNHGLDIGGKPIGVPTAFFAGVGVDPSAVNADRELTRFFSKAEAGAEFAVTQPVFDPDPLQRFLEKIGGLSIPILAGIWPLVSLRNAEFMKNEVPGVSLPDSVLNRIGRFDSKEDQLKAGIEMAQEMARIIRPLVSGIQISAPFGRVELAIEVASVVSE